MMGECSPLLAAASRAGLTTVTEFFILLSTERILSSEQNSFPDWEPRAPDLDAIRREFPCEQQILNHTRFAICPSDTVRADLEQHFAFPSCRSAVVPYCVDARWLTPDPCLVPRRILFVGTAGLRKGIHYFAAAADLLHSEGRDYEFRVAGDVTFRIAHHPRTRFLRFLGRVPRHQMKDEFLRADLFVLPSLAEGSAEAAYEALAVGLPVITTAATGSVARHGIEGFIVPPRDAASLAARIEQLIEDRPLRNRMAIAARDRARHYTLEHYGRRLVSALGGFAV
jgi:glycosyltransferase involved in cell wall biosynthesis